MFQLNDLNSKRKYVENKFLSDNIKVCNDWLSECVEFFVSECPRISNDDLFNKAREQWLLADLTEIGGGCLPDIITTKTQEYILDKKYPLQFQWLTNISESPYDILRELRKEKLDEGEEYNQSTNNKYESKKVRMLKLELTDGKLTVIGIEYSPIPCLSTKLTPGSKILLTGPIRVVNKVMFLEAKHVRILGGEVDSLLISNAYENILLKALGKPINPKPITDYEETTVKLPIKMPVLGPPPTLIPFVPPDNKIKRENKPNIKNEWNCMDDDELLLGINLDAIEKNVKKETIPTVTLDDDDDLFCNIDIKSVEKLQKPPPSISSPRFPMQPPKSLSHSRIFQDDDLDEISMLNELENEYNESRKNVLSNSNHNAKRRRSPDDFDDDDMDALNEIENQILNEAQDHSIHMKKLQSRNNVRTINQQPDGVDEDDLNALNEIEDELKINKKIVPKINNILPPNDAEDDDFVVIKPSKKIQNLIQKTPKIEQTTIQTKAKTLFHRPRQIISQDMIDDDDFDAMNSLEDKINNEITSKSSLKSSTAASIGKTNEGASNYSNTVIKNGWDKPSTSKQVNNYSKEPQPSTSKQQINKYNLNDFVDHSNLFDSTMEHDNLTVLHSILDDDYPFKINGFSLATNEQIHALNENEKNNKHFIIYCEIDSVVEKLQIKNCEYHLGVFLRDPTNRLLQARFETSVLSELSGFTPKELQEMRQSQKNQPQYKNDINEILTNLKNKLQELKMFMKIFYKLGSEYPIIIELLETNLNNCSLMEKKIADEKIIVR